METRRQRYAKRYTALEAERSSFMPDWEEISRYIFPRSARFVSSDRNRGGKRNTHILNETACFALRTFMSGLSTGITNPARPWFLFRTDDPELNEWRPMKEWLDIARMRVMETFLRSNVYTALPLIYGNLGAYGTSASILVEDDERYIRVETLPIGSYMLGTSFKGHVDTVYHKFEMTVWQLVKRFGIENCSQAVRNLYQNGNVDGWVQVVRTIEPNELYDAGKFKSKFKAWSSCYYEVSGNNDQMLGEYGFDEFPGITPRWNLTGEDVYGWGPGLESLGSVKQLQLEEKYKAELIVKMSRPPMGAPVALRGKRSSILAGDVTYYDKSQGGQGFEPLYQVNPSSLNALIEDINEVEDRINRGFYVDLFRMISNDERSQPATAEEIRERRSEKLMALGPAWERQNGELLNPLTKRTFNILYKAGVIPPMPEEARQRPLNVEYTSILHQAMRLQSMTGLTQFKNFVTELSAGTGAATPWDKVDLDAMVDEAAEILGVPPRIVVDEEKVAEIRDAHAQQAKSQEIMANAGAGAVAAKNFSQADLSPDSALGQMLARLQGAQS